MITWALFEVTYHPLPVEHLLGVFAEGEEPPGEVELDLVTWAGYPGDDDYLVGHHVVTGQEYELYRFEIADPQVETG